ncbi:hypothetical protein KY338_03445 [Candidatus Woesearchaeota archaeon]|nr:hypothetical protein [Candidatus Woesearchaeota archaeon]MBW3005342.1 hypothetical protein [Candidatus Woesearchaeota archaeon]
MANASLVKYIKDQLKAGYSTTEIRQTLLRQGNNTSVVDAAIKEAKPKPPLIWIAIALIILVIIVLTVLVYVKMQTPEKDILLPKEEIPIPEKEELQKEEIITEEEIDLDKIPVPPAEKIKIPPAEDTQEFESSMKIAEIREISTTEPDRAEALCSDLKTRMEKDSCYAQIAGTAAKPEFCAKISEQKVRDQCYFNLAAAGHNTCSKIKDETTKKSCTQLLMLNITAY